MEMFAKNKKNVKNILNTMPSEFYIQPNKAIIFIMFPKIQ